MNALIKYFETVRHLKVDQLYHRLKYRVLKPWMEKIIDCPKVKMPNGTWTRPLFRCRSYFGDKKFTFFGRTNVLSSVTDWERADSEELWNWNLHYFDDLASDYSLCRYESHRQLIKRWIKDNPGPSSIMAWDPYPTSLRSVNWIKWFYCGARFQSNWSENLFMQFRWLRKRLEFDLYGNHLITNAKALCFGGCFFSGDESQEWLRRGVQIIKGQLSEQVLADGGHFELSPMYHCIILEDVLDLINLSRSYPQKIEAKVISQLKECGRKMLRWLDIMVHPDGKIPFFNDAAFGIAASPVSLRDYAAKLSVNSPRHKQGAVWHLASSGYVRISQGNAVALLDVASIGPDYIPGHAHADTLSFEFSLFGQRLLVNSGTSLYESGLERLRQRGTAAHNTVQIDGENSSEVWGSFRVAKRAHPFDLQIREKNEFVDVQCSHDGYQRLPGRNIHQRKWRMDKQSLEIIDTIEGRFQSAVARYHLHPEIRVKGDNELELPNGKTVKYVLDGAPLRIEKTTWHSEFGKTIESQCLALDFDGPEVSITLSWA